MSRYTGPQWKISRRLGFSTLENGKELNRRPYAPGQHGQKRKKPTEYGLQLAEKQKVRHMYGVNEKQFHNTFKRAGKMSGIHGYNSGVLQLNNINFFETLDIALFFC